MKSSLRWYLRILVFVCGMVTLGAELAASRLLAPFLGTSLPVWSSLIGLILLALSVGYVIGGRIADASPRLTVLLRLVVAAGLLLVILPCIGRHVLHALTAAFVRLESGVLAGSFAAVIILLGAPMILLGCVTPFAVRLAAQDVAETGRTAGQLFAWSTVGSFVGSFLPVLVLIPSIGTRNTFVLFGSLLILISIPGYLVSRAGCAAIISSLLLPAAAAAGLFGAKGQIKEYQHGKLLFEGESAY